MVETFSVRLAHRGIAFDVRPEESVLQAAERCGVALRYGCRHGNCSTCKYLLVEGEVDHGNASPYSLSEFEREEGWALLCVARPLEDLIVEDDAAPDPRALPLLAPETQIATVAAVEPLSGGLFRLELDVLQPLTFYPGQFVELGVPGAADEWRSYSISTPPSSDRRLGFVVRAIDGGAFSGQLEALAPQSPIRLRGPFGGGYLRPGDDPILLVAGGGSGIAPILSILHHAAQASDRRPFTLVYGTRRQTALVALDEIEALSEQLTLTTVLCLSEPPEGSGREGFNRGWEAFDGDVTRAVQRFVGDASGLDAYLCGKPEMCDSVRRLLEAKGLDEGRAFADPFFPAVTVSGRAPSGAAVGMWATARPGG